MSQIFFKISAGFLLVALALLASSLYVSERYIQDQQQLAAAGDLNGAAREAESAARFDPFDSAPLVAQASLYDNRGRNPQSERAMKEAIRRSPNDYSLYISLGNVQMEMENFEEAEQTYRRALELNPMASTATSSIAQALVRRGDLEGAKKEYETLLEDRDIDTLGLYDLGRILVRTGEPQRGYRIINRAIKRTEREMSVMEEPQRSQQEVFIESMKLAAADALVVQGDYDGAYELVAESSSDQAPALLELISTDPEGYRESVVSSEIY